LKIEFPTSNLGNIETIKDLISILEQDSRKAVNARDLHAFLESKRQFGNWIKRPYRKI
jgi:hypothetical protein